LEQIIRLVPTISGGSEIATTDGAVCIP
jgi:hypothetical protein